MENELGAMLESVLSDPAQMQKITQMAQSLMGGPPKSEAESSGNTSVSPPTALSGAGDIVSLLGRVTKGRTEKSRSTQLLMAMRPYMRPDKQEKLDRAVKIAEIVNVAGSVMKEYGGDVFGSI